MSKIEYQYTPVTTQAEPAPKPDRLPPVSYHARAALLIGMFVFTAILAIGWVFDLSWQGILKAAIVLSILSAGTFGILWTWIATTHDWRMDTKERRRRWNREDADLYSYAPEPDEDYKMSQPLRLKEVCWDILKLHYVKKLQATRPQCERAGITQPEWNDANSLFKLVGLKGERGWNDDKSAVDAFAWFDDCTTFDRDAIWYSPAPDDKNLIRFLPGND